MVKVEVDGHEIHGTPEEILEVIRLRKLQQGGANPRPAVAPPTHKAGGLLRVAPGLSITAALVEKIPEPTFEGMVRSSPRITPAMAGKHLFGRWLKSTGDDTSAYRIVYYRLLRTRRRLAKESQLPQINLSAILGAPENPDDGEGNG